MGYIEQDIYLFPRSISENIKFGSPDASDEKILDAKFKTFGCGAAIAVSSMVSEMAMGKTLGEALKITPQSVADELGGLPKQKVHCSNLGAQALTKAIQDYMSKKKKEGGKR